MLVSIEYYEKEEQPETHCKLDKTIFICAQIFYKHLHWIEQENKL